MKIFRCLRPLRLWALGTTAVAGKVLRRVVRDVAAPASTSGLGDYRLDVAAAVAPNLSGVPVAHDCGGSRVAGREVIGEDGYIGKIYQRVVVVWVFRTLEVDPR